MKCSKYVAMTGILVAWLGLNDHLSAQSSGLGKGTSAASQSGDPNDGKVKARCIALEVYTRPSDPQFSESIASLKAEVSKRRGVAITVYDLESEPAKERYKKIQEHYKLTEEVPLLYGLNQTVQGTLSAEQWSSKLDGLLQVPVYVRSGCSRCAQFKEYLPTLQAKYPGLVFKLHDVIQDPKAAQDYQQLALKQKIGGVSYPGIWLCQQLVVGFEGTTASKTRFDTVLQRWTYDCQLPKVTMRSQPLDPLRMASDWNGAMDRTKWLSTNLGLHGLMYSMPLWMSMVMELRADQEPNTTQETPPPPQLDIGPGDPPPLSLQDSPTLPVEEDVSDAMDLPWLGRLSAGRWGMPAFTFLVGLVDGFNPCAMWVLLFLLSILVNLGDRRKILAVAGTFVVISGVAYYAFMAAWLNVLLWVGYLRWVQISLAMLAIVVGSIHIKDYFAFKKGITLSIPEAAKPGIYARTRSIIMAENMFGAIIGASVLAVLVNFIELLCTAGLPAMYSQILTMRNFPAWQNYCYLGLYILAYMLDDILMVSIVVVTMSKRKLQEKEGRWLKLASGVVILALGLVLIFKPQWLE